MDHHLQSNIISSRWITQLAKLAAFPSTQKSNSKYLLLLRTKMKALNYRVLIWITHFANRLERTTVRITFHNESPTRMEKMIEMGFKKGFITAMANLLYQMATLSKKC